MWHMLIQIVAGYIENFELFGVDESDREDVVEMIPCKIQDTKISKTDERWKTDLAYCVWWEIQEFQSW